MHYALCNVQYAVCTLQGAMRNVEYAKYNAYFAACNIQCAIFGMQFTRCAARFSLHITLLCLLYLSVDKYQKYKSVELGNQLGLACIYTRWTLCNFLYWRCLCVHFRPPLKCAFWSLLSGGCTITCSLILVGVGWKRGWRKASVWLGNKSYFYRLDSSSCTGAL